MGFNVSWDDQTEDRYILCYTVTGRWTWEEFYAARDQARTLADSVDQAVIDSIIDLRLGILFPQNALSHFRRMSANSHPKLEPGIVVIVQNSLFVRSLMDIMRHISRERMRNFHIARTLEEAHIILFEARQHISSTFT
jgi:hypothetical protein